MADRIELLEQRVTVIEREIDGEKRVTRHILEQTRLNGSDLATIKTRQDRLEHKFDSFVRDFPVMVAQTMRDVLNEREK